MAAPAVALAAPISLAAPVRRRPALAVTAVAAATLLLLLSVQGWAPQLFERRSSPATSPAAPVHTPRVDAATAADVALHTPVPVPGQPGTLRVQAPDYTAGFDAAGLSFAPTGVTAPVRIDLASIERGGQALALDRHGWEASGTRASRPVHEGVREQVTTRTGEVEWDVVLAAPPAGRGDLVVRAGLTGLTGVPVQERVGGRPSWLLDGAGGQVRLGETVVKDTSGAVLHRDLPTIGPDGLTLTVPSSVLENARYPLTVDPTVGTVRDLTPVGRYYNPSIAYDSTNDQYLVAYTFSVDSNTDVYGIRLRGSDGVPIGGPKQLSFRAELEVTPDVAWNGRDWLVVWEHYYSNNDQDIRGILVNSSGDRVGNEIAIATATATEQSPAVAAGGSSFLVTWRDFSTGEYEIQGRRVSGYGTIEDASKINISRTSSLQDLEPDVAFNGSVWMVAWEGQVGINDGLVPIRVVRRDGSVGSSNAVAFRNEHPRDPAIASNGNRFFVVWEQPTGQNGTYDIWSAHVNPDNLSDYVSVPVSTAATDQTDPAVAYNGSYLVSWKDRRHPPDPDIYAARVNNDGSVADPNGFGIIITTAEEDQPAVSRGPSGGWSVGWEAGSGNNSSVKFRTVSK